MDITKFNKTLLALSITAILSACGGGGGSDDDSSGDAIDATLSGVAAKGIIIAGNVVADELNADKSIKNANVGSATTDSEGRYSLELNDTYEGGPIKLTVSASTDTTTVCDATSGCGTRTDSMSDSTPATIDFGEQYKPSSLSMTALLPDAEDGEAIEVQITPFTHMAAENALSNPSIDADDITAANSEVSVLLNGLDILRTEPVDITNLEGDEDADAVAYAALTASIAEIADDDANGQPIISQALTDLATQFSAGTFTATDMQEILDEAVDTLAEVGAVDTSGMVDAIQDDIDDAIANSGGVIDPEPNPNAGDSNVELAKDFIADLRTWGVTIGSEIDTPSEAFEMQLDMADEASEMMSDAAGEAIGYGAMAIAQFFLDDITDISQFLDEGSNPFTQGTLSSNTAGDEYSLTGAIIILDEEEVSLDMTVQVPADGSTGNVLTFVVQNITSEDNSSRIVVENGSIKVTLEESYTIDYAALEADTAMEPSAPEIIEFDFDAAFTQLITLDTTGMVIEAADPVTFAGTLETTVYPYTDSHGEVLDILPGSFSATGTISNTTGDSFDASFTASIPNAASITPLGTVYDLDSSYADNNGGDHLISWDVEVNTFTYQNPDENYLLTFDPADGSVDIVIDSNFIGHIESTDPGPYASLEAYAIANGPFSPNDYVYDYWIDGHGEYEREFSEQLIDYSTDGFVEFRLDEVDLEYFDETQPVIGSVGLQFSAQFDGLPEAQVSVTGSATDYEAGNANVTISYGDRSLEFDVSNDTADGDVAALEITNQDAVVLTLTGQNLNDEVLDNETASITINNVEVATVEGLDGSIKVSYIDGTFEIF